MSRAFPVSWRCAAVMSRAGSGLPPTRLVHGPACLRFNNSPTVSQGAGRPFSRNREVAVPPDTAKARASAGADGWGDDPKTILLFKCTPDGCGPSRFLTVCWGGDGFPCTCPSIQGVGVGHDPAHKPTQQSDNPQRHPDCRGSPLERQPDEQRERASGQECPAIGQQAERGDETAALAVAGNCPRHRVEDSAERGQENQPLLVIAGRFHARPEVQAVVRQESVELSVE